MNRRHFCSALGSGAISCLNGQPSNEWGNPVLDIHLHPRAGSGRPNIAGGELAHVTGAGMTKAVLLNRPETAGHSKALVKQHPDRFVWSVSTDVTKPGAIDVLRRHLADGAIALGEANSGGTGCDSKPMLALYALAAEMNVPVMFHFADFAQYEGQVPPTPGVRRFPAVVKANPKTTFVCHADAFWANVSTDVPEGIPYPTGKIKTGGVSDHLLRDFPNVHADMSAYSCRNFLGRDPEFAAKFIERHRAKLMFGSDCRCRDGKGADQGAELRDGNRKYVGNADQRPLIARQCMGRSTLTALKQMTSAAVFRQITWENATKLYKIR
jgi:predicted TIM-barrel fold metal-dependent hydrolase